MSTLPSKQKAILDYVSEHGSISTKIANQMLAAFYYNNHEHYVSEILTKMVRAGKLIRVSLGVYELGVKHTPVDVKQNSLF